MCVVSGDGGDGGILQIVWTMYIMVYHSVSKNKGVFYLILI